MLYLIRGVISLMDSCALQVGILGVGQNSWKFEWFLAWGDLTACKNWLVRKAKYIDMGTVLCVQFDCGEDIDWLLWPNKGYENVAFSTAHSH